MEHGYLSVGPLAAGDDVEYQLRRGDLADRLLQLLNEDIEHVWSHEIKPQQTVVSTAKSGEDTILGDFLSAVSRLKENAKCDRSRFDAGRIRHVRRIDCHVEIHGTTTSANVYFRKWRLWGLICLAESTRPQRPRSMRHRTSRHLIQEFGP